MAVMAFTRRHVVDMIPEFLTKRGATVTPVGRAFAEENGITSELLSGLFSSVLLWERDVVLRERYFWRSPYALKRSIDQGWASLVDAGLAEPIDGGWRVSPRASDLMDRWAARRREHFRSLPVPAEATKRAADAAEPIAAKIPSSAERSALTRKLAPRQGEPASDLVRLDTALYAIWYFRDDCHIGAWQDAGYEGPVFDVLSFMWPGRPDMSYTKMPGATSFEALATALKDRQDRADVERAVETLVKRGDVTRDGDSVSLTDKGQRTRDDIEDETDRRFFAIWTLDDAATDRFGQDLRAVIDGLPKP